MILVHYTIQICVNWNSKTLIVSLKIAILVILPIARVGKQLVPCGNLIDHHVPTVDFVQH